MLFLQLGISAENPSEFLTQAKKIVTGHKELQGHLNNIQGQVSSLEMERNKLVVSSLSVHLVRRICIKTCSIVVLTEEI